MDATSPCEPMGPGAVSLDEDLLLRDVLAIIGDLGCDLDDPLLSPDETDEPQPLVDDCCSPLDGSLASTYSDEQVGSAPSSGNAQWPTLFSSLGSNATGTRPKRRRREELLYLRGLVAELEGRLSGLRQPEEQDREQQCEAREDESERVAAVLWEKVAVRQRDQREKAELENMKLKRMLQDQIQVGKRLERLLLRKRPNVAAMESIAPQAKRFNGNSSRAWSRVQLFDHLLASCAALYAATERVMARFDRGIPTPVPRKVELVHDPENGLAVQNAERRILPFNHEEVAEEMWPLFPEESTLIQDVDHGCDDISELVFRVETQVGHVRGDFIVTLVKRRYVEEQRTVIVYSASIDPSEVSATKMDGISIRHKAWHVIEPLPSNPSRGSLMTVYHVSVPVIATSTADQERKVGTLTNFLLSAISMKLEAHHQSLENRLIECNLLNSRKSA